MIFLAILTCLVWPKVQLGIASLQGFMRTSGVVGVWVYCFLQRVLIPTGLHHFIYIPFQYGPAAVAGGLQPWWLKHLTEFAASTQPLKTLAPSMGFELFGNEKVFGIPAICLAFYATARKSRKKQTAALLIPAGLTSFFAGITEPVEFTFLFAAPVLWFVHSFLAATLDAVMYAFGVVGQFDGGFIAFASENWIPLWANHWQTWVTQIVIGLIFAVIYFFVFKILIERFNFVTPGRESEGEDTKLINKKEYKAQKSGTKNNPYIERASAYLEGLGGSGNIEDMTSCATRLRVTVKDPEKLASDATFKANKAVGVVHHGKAVQVIVGLDVAQVLEKMQDLSSGPVGVTTHDDVSVDNSSVENATPMQQNASLILDSVGTINNVESVNDSGNGVEVTVVDPSQVDSKEVFTSLGLGITDVSLNGKLVTIQIKNHDVYAHTMKALL